MKISKKTLILAGLLGAVTLWSTHNLSAQGQLTPRNLRTNGNHYLVSAPKSPDALLRDSTTVAIPPGPVRLRISDRMRVCNLKQGKEGWQTARIGMRYEDKVGNLLGYPDSPQAKADIPWTTLSAESHIPAGAHHVDVDAGNFGVSGEVALPMPILPGTYTSSWIGNTFGKGGEASALNSAWVQDYIDEMVVQSDGTINTKSGWDEHHREFGIYKDGKVLGNEDRKINGREVFISGKRWFIEGNVIKGPQTITAAGKPTGLAKTNDDQLIVADDGPRKQVLFFDVSGRNVSGKPRLVGTFGVKGGIGSGYKSSYAIRAAINSPAFPVSTYAPGVYHPFKLWDLTGVGMDKQGRLFVSQSGGATAIRCFRKNSKDQWIVDFFLECYIFVDNADGDASTDALDVYTSQERYSMDFSRSAFGSEWKLKSFTADRLKYPNDPRTILDVKAGHEHGITATRIRYISGKRFLYTQGMTSQGINIFRFNAGADIAVPAGFIMESQHRIYDLPITFFWPPNRPKIEEGTMIWRDLNGDGDYQANEYSKSSSALSTNFWIDSKGGIWEAGNIIKLRKCAGLDAKGNPIYNDANVDSYTITGTDDIGRVIYQEDMDRLILCSKNGRNLKSGKMYAVDNWSKGNRAARYLCDMKGPNPSAVTAEKNYLFEAGYESRAEVFVSDIKTGKTLGTMVPAKELGGIEHTGWVDIGWGVNAYQRKNGEFLVFVEDDSLSRVIMYRWLPNARKTRTKKAG